MLKLNLGCGFRKIPDYVNVDMDSGCQPDQVLDLTQETWPWQDNSVTEVHFELSLEQMGETRSAFLNIFKEMYRVCSHGAKISILTLHPRHEAFVMNPLCLHPLGPEFISSLSFQNNMTQIANGLSGDHLAFRLGVNFEMGKSDLLFAQEFETQFNQGTVGAEDLRRRMYYENNICQGIRYELSVIKQ